MLMIVEPENTSQHHPGSTLEAAAVLHDDHGPRGGEPLFPWVTLYIDSAAGTI